MTREQVPFEAVAETDDPLELEHLRRALELEGIAVLVEDRWGGLASGLTDGLTHPWWTLAVPGPERARAGGIVAEERRSLALHQDEDARAAEEESAATAGGDTAPRPPGGPAG
jgi:hypothetical protein